MIGTYAISNFERATGVKPTTIRWYEQEGWLPPPGRTEGWASRQWRGPSAWPGIHPPCAGTRLREPCHSCFARPRGQVRCRLRAGACPGHGADLPDHRTITATGGAAHGASAHGDELRGCSSPNTPPCIASTWLSPNAVFEVFDIAYWRAERRNHYRCMERDALDKADQNFL